MTGLGVGVTTTRSEEQANIRPNPRRARATIPLLLVIGDLQCVTLLTPRILPQRDSFGGTCSWRGRISDKDGMLSVHSYVGRKIGGTGTVLNEPILEVYGRRSPWGAREVQESLFPHNYMEESESSSP